MEPWNVQMMMTCHEAHTKMKKGASLSDPRLAEHVNRCLACRELAAASGNLVGLLESPEGGEEPGLEDLFQAVRADLNRERGIRAYLRSRSTGLRMAMAGAVAGLVAAAVVFGTPRVDLSVYPPMRMAVEVVATSVLLGLGVAGALRSLSRLRLRLSGAFTTAAVLVPGVLAVLPQAHADHPASLGGTGHAFWSSAAACCVFGVLAGLPLLWAMWFLGRTRHAGQPEALVAAVSAGLVGHLALQLHCPVVHTAHLAAGHVSVMLIFLAVYGIGVGRRRARVPIGPST